MTLPSTPVEALEAAVLLALEGDRGFYLDAEVPSVVWGVHHWQALHWEIGARADGAAAREEQPFWREHPEAFVRARMERGV